MDLEKGYIITQEELENMNKIQQAKHIPIKEQFMTVKQKENMQVSTFDNRSVLGKIRIQHRNGLRNKPCPCGSGRKFKKCCWDKTI
jgi:uncharacterized protein YecA (UPF0149 family)